MLRNTHVNIIKIVECILYLACFSASAIFLKNAFQKYMDAKTSFSVRREPIRRFPVITLCFSGRNSTKTSYEYGYDFRIEYILWTGGSPPIYTFLTEGKNHPPVLKAPVHLHKFITAYMGNCYKVKSESPGLVKNNFQEFMLHFNKSIPYKDLPALKLFFTSGKNVYGVSFNEAKNGHMTQLDIGKDMYKKFDLREEKTVYIPRHSRKEEILKKKCLSLDI